MALWRGLAETNAGPARYLGRALLLDLPVTCLAALLVHLVLAVPPPTFATYSLGFVFLLTCLAAPLIETVVLAAMAELLRFGIRSPWRAAAVLAVIWAGLHSLATPTWGLIVGWTFFLQSMCYLVWRRQSWPHAFGLTLLLHVAHNLAAFAVLVVHRATA